MALSSEQRQVLSRIKQIGRARGASPKEIKSAIETGIVESNLSNPSGGDADSAGWRQERASLYKDPQNLDASINRYFDETRAVKSKYGTAGALAAAVQRPAAQYAGRYQANSARAQALLGGASSGGGATSTTMSSVTTPGVDNSQARAAAVQSFLGNKNADPVDFALAIRGAQDTPAVTRTSTSSRPAVSSSSKAPGSGVTTFEGKEVAAWMVPALKYARASGVWKGTVTSGVRTRAQQAALYANRASNPNPVAKPGQSNHEVDEGGGGAVDVTDPTGLAKALRGYKGKTLKQGLAIHDPIHFSASGT